ncbi:PHD and RING finger domain-containing protein 1 isoform X2 [Hippocampus comes]|uniref:PHD and RING finger domain-containing protein 1 isoform X2 n=1 Tax=Hippocampus comes TaxID=109280 RepID=UPI00094E03FD|nr:PREDICTED: PHD and RING finger domain-containing protein 1 isoform X2 [Hippocampus comes]
MDDDDSPDELIRRGVHKKRPAPWNISDSDDDIDASEDGESESSDEDDSDDNDDDLEGEDEEEDAKAGDGVLGEPSTTISTMSSDEDADTCPICLNTFSNQPVATPENCEHYFCLDCILAWSKNANSCPVDRITFNSIYLRKSYGGKVQKMITVQKTVKEDEVETVDLDLEQTNCEVCHGSDREDRLLLCDGCDAGYHMECLTPPLDTVPVEEWFCPECVANNNSGSGEEQNQTQRLPSTAQPTTSRSQSRAAGPIRAIARTQHSERVRANVNRHRITQARTSQLAPTDQIQSNWLDETINAVVAGLNTAIYVRDLTPCAPTRRRRKTGTRRKATKKKALSVKGKKGHSTKARRKRKGRRTTSKKTLVGKKVATPRSRIANSLGLSKDNNFSLPTVCRPSEHTLSNMRADIGAASLSIYGDPFDLDPFVDREEDEQEETVSSLLEAKRRGISHSAFRSHQPVARPVSMGMSRHGMDIPQTGGVVEAAPVPDLLGSILSGQSLLLMDSSDVIISRDGYLKASQAESSSTLKPGLRERSSSEESRAFAQPVVSDSQGESSSSRHLTGPSHNNFNRPLSKCFSPVPSDVSHIQPPYNPNLSSRGHKCFQPPLKNRPSSSFGVQATSGASTCAVPSSCRVSDPRSNSKTTLPLQRQPIKAPTKPVWEDVDVLPRIPKIKRDATNSSTNKSNNNSSSSMNTSGMPETALVSFAGDQNRQKDVAQQSNPERQPQNQGAGSSSAFANSFSLSSSTASPSASMYNPAVSSSSSSSISFRINISRNSWHSRRVILPSSSASGSGTQAEREKMDEAKKKQEHRDKQKLMASHTAASNKKDENVYDPFNPTVSDASSSDSEGESLASSFHGFNLVSRPAFSRDVAQSKQKLLQVKTETPESEVAQEDPRSAHLQTSSRVGSCASRVVKVEKESVLVKTENQTAFSGIEVKRQTGLADSGKDIFGHSVKSRASETPVAFSPQSLDHLKIEEESGQKVITSKNVPQNKVDSSGSGSCFMKVKLKEKIKSDPRAPEKKTSTTTLLDQQQQSTSSILASDRDKTKDHLVSKQGDQPKKMDKDRERRSRSRERRTHSMSESSQSSSPKATVKKRRRRSRSGSNSSTAEHSSRKKYKESSQESSNSGHEKRRASNDKTRHLRSRSRSGDRTKDRRRGRSRLKSPSKSPYRSRSKERRKEHTHSCHEDVKAPPKDKRRPRSRSSSRERRKVDSSSENLTKSSVSCFSSSKYDKDPKETGKLSSGKEETIPEVKKDVSKCTFVAKVKKENDNADIMAISKGIKKEINIVKEVKKDKQEFIDMFQCSPIPPHSEKEDRPSTIQEIKKEPVKIEVCKTMKTEETCEITRIKPEPVSAELPVTSPHASVGQQESPKHFQPNGKGLANQASAIELKVPMKQAPESDEGISVDMLLHSLDCVKQEHTEGIGAKVKQEDIKQEGKTEAQQLPTASKNKIQGKRVTWNIQVPDGAQPDKCASKRALYKRKLKQEATHRPPSMSTSQDTSGPGSVSDSSKRDDGTLPTGSGCQAYLKKLHMQERAIEEVKLAIKPFYQKRDINKEEYKAILRKAVQKVCHSKSGEINPVKVGNLVKAYVDKYKHARKHQKSETKPTKTS